MQEILKKREYEFLYHNEHLGKNVILLCVSGSLGYGTGDEQSDVDLRGIALNRKSELIGFDVYEQYEDQQTDTVIYTFNKAIKLFSECNPNMLEMLGLRPEHYLFLHPIGSDLIRRSEMFLSKRAIRSFSKYASSQLRRLENALARNHFSSIQREAHVLESMQDALRSLMKKYEFSDDRTIQLYQKKDPMIDIQLRHVPLKKCIRLFSEISNIAKSYEKSEPSRSKKDDRHLNKHAMHLVRLYLMAIDILEKGRIITYREEEKDLLLKIKRGEFQNATGEFKTEFYDIVREYETKLIRAAKHTTLPDQPDRKLILDYVMEINRKVINDDF